MDEDHREAIAIKAKIGLRLVVVVSDEQGYARESQDEFEGDDEDVLHNGNGFYKLGEMAHIQLSRLCSWVLAKS